MLNRVLDAFYAFSQLTLTTILWARFPGFPGGDWASKCLRKLPTIIQLSSSQDLNLDASGSKVLTSNPTASLLQYALPQLFWLLWGQPLEVVLAFKNHWMHFKRLQPQFSSHMYYIPYHCPELHSVAHEKTHYPCSLSMNRRTYIPRKLLDSSGSEKIELGLQSRSI